MVRSGWGIVMMGVLVLALWVTLLLPRFDRPVRSREDCQAQQKLWDGQIAIIQYVAQNLTGSPVETDLAIEGLREQLGPRPAC